MVKKKIKFTKREAQLVVLLIGEETNNNSCSLPSTTTTGDFLQLIYWSVLLQLKEQLSNYSWTTNRKVVALTMPQLFALLQLLKTTTAQNPLDLIIGRELFNKVFEAYQQPILNTNNLFT